MIALYQNPEFLEAERRVQDALNAMREACERGDAEAFKTAREAERQASAEFSKVGGPF